MNSFCNSFITGASRKQILQLVCCFVFRRQTVFHCWIYLFFLIQNPAGEIRPASLGSPITQRHLHGDRLSRKHDAPHPVFKERGGAAEEAAEGRSVTAYVVSGFTGLPSAELVRLPSVGFY